MPPGKTGNRKVPKLRNLPEAAGHFGGEIYQGSPRRFDVDQIMGHVGAKDLERTAALAAKYNKYLEGGNGRALVQTVAQVPETMDYRAQVAQILGKAKARRKELTERTL